MNRPRRSPVPLLPRHKGPTPKTGARWPANKACESPPLRPPSPLPSPPFPPFPPCFRSRRSQGREPPGPRHVDAETTRQVPQAAARLPPALPLLSPRGRPRLRRLAPGRLVYPSCCCCSSWISRNLLTTKDRKICSILVAMTALRHRRPAAPTSPAAALRFPFLPRREASNIPQGTAATRGRGPVLTSSLYALSRLAAL